MTRQTLQQPPAGFGSWQDAEALRRWSFLQRTPQQRLDWLVAALTIHYQIQNMKKTPHPS
jgi:hypothetical protein